MKSLILVFFIGIFLPKYTYGQNPNYPLDNSNTTIYSEIVGDNNNAVRFSNDTFYVNSSTHYLHKYFNFESSEDSIINISDTIIKKYTDVFLIDTINNTTLKIYKQEITFNWCKNIPYNPETINPPSTAYKKTYGRWDDCTYYIYVYGISKICFAVMICDLPDNDTYVWCSEQRYTKIFEDNFDGNQIDRDHWKIGYDWGRENGLSTAPDAGIALNRNIEVSGGTLKLTCQRESSTIIDNDGTVYPSRNFSNGVLTSELNYGYGKYSMRAKVPQSAGVNPAYWLYSSEIEIDGFEFFLMNRADAPYMTVFSNLNTYLTGGPCFGYGGKSRILQQTGNKGVWSGLPNLADGNWYIYTLVYDPKYITWFIETDNHLYAWKLTYPYVHQAGYLNIDPNQNCSCTGCVVQVNANFPGHINGNVKFILDNAATQSKDFTSGALQQLGPYAGAPSIMEVDWVKIYVPDSCAINVNEGSGKFRALDHGNENHITGNNVTLGGNGTLSPANEYKIKFDYYSSLNPEDVSPRTHCTARANSELALLDGFSVDENALFEGTIAYDGNNGSGVPSDCNNITFWPQIYRTSNSDGLDADTTVAYIKSKNAIIFPNPTKDNLTILTQSFISKVEIYNSIGQLVFINTEANSKINISSLVNGIYFLKLYFENETTISKFIKENI